MKNFISIVLQKANFFETLINQCLVKVNKLNLIPNSKFDVLECILTGLKEAFTSPDFDKK